MPTISEKLTHINNIKKEIKEAIIAGGGTVGDDFSKYPEAVSKFSIDYKNPDFYDLRTQNGTNYDNLFRGYNGPDIDMSAWDTSKVTSAQYAFAECKKSMDISNWDLSSLTNAQYMFYSFNNNETYIDLSVLDFSKVTNAYYMFAFSNTDYLDVRNIKLTDITSYDSLFRFCFGSELDLSTWYISNITNIKYMFNQSKHKKIDLTGWNTVNVIDMYGTFYYSQELETLLIPDWDMTNATNTSNFIYKCSKLKYIDLSRSNDFTINKIVPMLPTKKQADYGEILVPADTSQDAINAVIAKYWKPIGPKIDLTSTELVLELDEIKPGKTTKIWICNNDPWYGDDKPETIEFISSNESVATINGREITGITEGTVTIDCKRREDGVVLGSTTLTVSETDSKPNLIKFRIDSSNLNDYYGAITVNGKSFNPNQLTKNDITGIYSYDPGKQITSIRFGDPPYNYTSEIVKFNFNAANITDMNSIFKYYKGTTFDLSDWDTSKVKNMCFLFSDSENLKTIIGTLDLSNLSRGWFGSPDSGIGYTAFYNCYSLEYVSMVNIYKDCDMSIEEYTSYNSRWSINLSCTVIKNECLIQIINELPNLYDKNAKNIDKIYFTLPPTNTLTAEQVQPAIDKGWTVRNCNF